MRQTYPSELYEFAKEHCNDLTINELTDICNERFKQEMPYERRTLYNQLYHKGITMKRRKYTRLRTFTEEEQEFVLKNYKGITKPKMAKMLKEEFGKDHSANQMMHLYKMLKISNGRVKRDAAYVPAERLPIGTVRYTGGNLMIKADEGNWTNLSRHMYQQYHPEEKLTSDDYIIFMDNDRMNFSKKNLRRISNSESLLMSRLNLRTDSPELMETAILIVRARCLKNEKVKAKEGIKK